MPRLKTANNARTALAESVGDTQTSLVVVDATGFPAPPFRITVDDEIMEVTQVNGTTWTVIRAVEGTVAAAHNSGATVENRWTAGTYSELAGLDDLAGARTDDTKPLVVEVSSSAPSSPVNGQVWYDSVNNKFKGFANGVWV